MDEVYIFSNIQIRFFFSEFSHQSPDMIVGLSTYQDHNSAYYTFNVWNPTKNLLQTIPWNSNNGLKLVNLFDRLRPTLTPFAKSSEFL